jgi:MATE family multidrug resistance protein
VTMVLNSVQPVISGMNLLPFSLSTSWWVTYHHFSLSPIHQFVIILTGVAVGGGWQALVAYINVGCYYLFGLPLGYLLGYTAELGVKVMYSPFIILFLFVSKHPQRTS